MREVERLLRIIVEEYPGDLPLELWVGANIEAVRQAAFRVQRGELPAAAEQGLLDIQIIVRPGF